MNNAELKHALNNHRGGDRYYRHWSQRIRYTEGIRYMAEQAEAYWLIDLAASWQFDRRVRHEDFQVFKLDVDTEQHEGIVTITDGDGHMLASQKIPYTDFPLDEFKCWVIDGTMLLPSEY